MVRKKKTSGCPECGCKHFFEDPVRGERVCGKCGLVLEDEMVDTSPEWRAFDSDQRSKRTRAGAPLTFSIDAQEPILIKENNRIKVVKIGEFVDKIVEENKENVQKQEILEIAFLKDSKYKAVSFDKNYKLDFHTITEVSRHPVKKLYELSVEGGKRIKVTGSHSVFTIKDNKIVKIRVDKLRKGEFVVAPKKLPASSMPLELDLIKEFSGLGIKNIYLRNITDFNLFESLKKANYKRGANCLAHISKRKIKDWKRHKTIPLYILADIQGLNWKINGEKIGIYSSPIGFPTSMKITNDFCKLLGFYAAEGDCSNYVVRFSFGKHEKDYIHEVKLLIKDIFDLDAKEYEHGSSVQLEIKSRLLSLFFTGILKIGKRAKEKRVPSIIFSLPNEMKLSFIHGYIAGDGHVWHREGSRDTQVGATSASKDLMDDLLFLYSQLGIHANYVQANIPSHTIEKTAQVLPDSIANMVRITNPDIAQKLGFIEDIKKRERKGAIEELIPAPLKYKKEWEFRKRIRIGRELAIKIAKKYNDKDLLRIAKSDFIFLRVKNIRKSKSSNGYAYDLTVPGYENFTGRIIACNTKHDKGLTTEIGKGKGELFKVAPSKRAQYHRLKIWQKRLVESKDRNLSFALSELQRLISFLGLPHKVHEEVAKKYEQAVDRGLVRGRSMESVIASLLYAICREMETPRTLEEIAEASGVERREIGRTYRYISRELKIRILPAPPQDYIPRFASMLGLSDKVQARAIRFLVLAKKNEVTSGKGPTGVAAAALYIAAVLEGEKRTQREIADAIGVTEVTIRNRFKELCEKLGIEDEVEKKVKELGS